VNASTQTRQLALSLLAALCMALALLPAAASAETTPVYIHESRQAFEEQLAKKEIKSAEFNRKLRSLHIVANDGKLYLYHYEKKGSPALEKQLTTHHVTFTVLSPSAAANEAKGKTTKHKIRYIVGGVVVLLIVIGAVVYFVRRRSMSD
jgi:hypothetical protein